MKPNDWIDGKTLISKRLHSKMLAGEIKHGKVSNESPPLRFDKALRLQGLVFEGYTRSDSEAFDPIGLELA